MRILTTMLKQDAVYWPMTGYDGAGRPRFGSPVQIKCRWEDVHEVFIDLEGRETVSNSKVYVDRDVVPEGKLKLLDPGDTVADLPSTNPHNNQGVYSIKKFEKLPTLKATKFLRTAML